MSVTLVKLSLIFFHSADYVKIIFFSCMALNNLSNTVCRQNKMNTKKRIHSKISKWEIFLSHSGDFSHKTYNREKIFQLAQFTWQFCLHHALTIWFLSTCFCHNIENAESVEESKERQLFSMKLSENAFEILELEQIKSFLFYILSFAVLECDFTSLSCFGFFLFIFFFFIDKNWFLIL